MATFHITPDTYRTMIKRAQKYNTCYWDCIELPNGDIITYTLNNGKPSDVEVFDMFDYRQDHDFSLDTFRRMAEDMNAVSYDLFGRGYICGQRVCA